MLISFLVRIDVFCALFGRLLQAYPSTRLVGVELFPRFALLIRSCLVAFLATMVLVFPFYELSTPFERM